MTPGGAKPPPGKKPQNRFCRREAAAEKNPTIKSAEDGQNL